MGGKGGIMLGSGCFDLSLVLGCLVKEGLALAFQLCELSGELGSCTLCSLGALVGRGDLGQGLAPLGSTLLGRERWPT